MPVSEAAPLNEIRDSLIRLSARLDNAEALQRTATHQLEQMYNLLTERLNTKDDTIAKLKEQSEWILKQNDTLLQQIGLRWNLLTGLTTLIGLALTIAFGYQLWRVEQVMETKKTLEMLAEKTKDDADSLAKNTKRFSEIIAKVASADSLITDANREFLRAEYFLAEKRSSDAIDLLRSALQSTGENIGELKKQAIYDAKKCSVHVPPPISGQATPDSQSVVNPEALRPVVKEALFTAYDLHARAAFFSQSRSSLRDDAIVLLTLKPAQWEGYHWMGLAAEENGAGSYEEAIICFNRSVDINPTGNKDYINLAELQFIQSRYPQALTNANSYLRPLKYRFRTPVDVIAHFYFSAAGILTDNQLAKKEMPPDKFLNEVGELRDFSIQGTFSAKDLIDYLSKSEEFSKEPENKKKLIKGMADCLIDKKCK